MAVLSKVDLQTQVDTAFADNTTGLITAALARDHLTDEIDSFALQSEATALVTLAGVSSLSLHYGTFTGTTLTNNQPGKVLFQELEVAVELRATITVVTEIDDNVNDVITALGIAENAQNFATFTGALFSDNQNAKQLFQAAETAIEANTASIATKSNITRTVRANTGTTDTLVLGDAGNVVTSSNASAQTITIPTNASVAYLVGTQIDIWQIGAGITTVDGDTGVTVNGVSGGGAAVTTQYKAVTILKIATNTWIMVGAHGLVA